MEIKKGQRLEIEISDFGKNGEGIGKCPVLSDKESGDSTHGDFVVFINGAVPGDTVLAELTTVKKNYGLGRLVEIIKPSDSRVVPRCESFGECGGCNFLHIDYETELSFKRKTVNDALRRIGGLNFEIEEIIGMDEPYFYRNKAVYHIADSKGKIQIGFYGAKTKKVAPVSGCVMFGVENEKIITAFKGYMLESGVLPYDGASGRGLVEALMIRRSFHSGDILVSIVARSKSLPNRAGLVYRLTESAPRIKGITLVVSDKHGRHISGGNFIWGEKYIIDKIDEYEFKISDTSFFQVNPKMTSVLYKKAREFAGLSKKDTAIDAYAGTGAISVFIAREAKKVIGIELNSAAVLDAEENAERNNVRNVSFIKGDAGSVFDTLFEEGVRPTAVILDPPRGGCSGNVITGLIKLAPKRIVYVSCDPATLARDLKAISELGYEAEKGVCVDMFGRCAHVECVIALKRKNG